MASEAVTSAYTSAWVLGSFLAVYFFPSLVVAGRQTVSGNKVFWFNLLFGWTFIGWLAAFFWAVTAEKKP